MIIHAANTLGNKLDGLLRGTTSLELRERMEAGDDIALIDVRSPGEHEEAAIPGSRLITLGALRERADEVPQEGSVVLHCDTSLRAWEACATLSDRGHDNLEILDGSIMAWSFETVGDEAGELRGSTARRVCRGDPLTAARAQGAVPSPPSPACRGAPARRRPGLRPRRTRPGGRPGRRRAHPASLRRGPPPRR